LKLLKTNTLTRSHDILLTKYHKEFIVKEMLGFSYSATKKLYSL